MSKPLGLETKREQNVVYLQIKDQCICEYSKVERQGYEPIEVRNPQTKEDLTRFIKRYDGINAYVDEIEFRNEEHKDVQYVSWKLHLDCGDYKAVLEIDFNSAPSTRFQKMAEGVDWNKPVYFRAFVDPNRKNATAFMMSQDDKNIPQRYTKETPNGLPEPVKGLTGWNYSAQQEFLYSRMVNIVIPACAAAATARQAAKGERPSDPQAPDPASEPEAPETTRWSPPATTKPTESEPAATQAPKEPPSELATIANKVRILAAGKGIPNLDAFIKTVLNKETPTMATVDEANTVLQQLKAL